jgi:hypothetical protein
VTFWALRFAANCPNYLRRFRHQQQLTFKHFLFLPSLVAFLVKVSSAVAAAHIVCREPFKALMTV